MSQPLDRDGSEQPAAAPSAAVLLRAARRRADVSQRELARRAGVSVSSVGRIESGDRDPCLSVLNRLLAACDLQLVLADGRGERVLIRDPSGRVRDGGGRRFPAHLDLREVIAAGDWWHDKWCTHAQCAAPRWTFDRDRDTRDRHRAEPLPPPPAQITARLGPAGSGRWRLIMMPEAARALATFGDSVELEIAEVGAVAATVLRAERQWYALADLPPSVRGASAVLRPRRGAAAGPHTAY